MYVVKRHFTTTYHSPIYQTIKCYYQLKIFIVIARMFVFNRRASAQHKPGMTAINKQNRPNTHIKTKYVYACM
jgi:hypothetical protein